MKICQKCSTGNENNALHCKDCGHSLSKAIIEEDRDYVKEMMERQDKRHRHQMRIHGIALGILGLIDIFFYIMALMKGQIFIPTVMLLLFPLLSYLHLYQPRLLFSLRHFATIDNLEDVELSNWYVLNCKIGGYVFAVLGTVMMALMGMAG